ERSSATDRSASSRNRATSWRAAASRVDRLLRVCTSEIAVVTAKAMTPKVSANIASSYRLRLASNHKMPLTEGNCAGSSDAAPAAEGQKEPRTSCRSADPAANLARPATLVRVSTRPVGSGIPDPLSSFRRRPAKKSLRDRIGRESFEILPPRGQKRNRRKTYSPSKRAVDR